jgi:hypothetical protein
MRHFATLRDRATRRLTRETICATLAGVFALALGATVLCPRTALAQSKPSKPVVVDPAAGNIPEIGLDPDVGDGTSRRTGRAVTPLVVPVPFKNTQLGWGLMLMGGLMHRFDGDKTIKPSTGMIGAFYTENGSWGMMAMENARLAGDRWRLRGMLGHPEIRFDYYGTGEEAGEAGRSVGIQQNINMAQIAALRRVANGVYLGATALYMGASIAVRDTTGLGLPPQAADTVDVTLFAPGLQAEVDTRNDDYWPVRGTLVRLKGWFFGGDRSFQRYLLNWSWYAPVRGEQAGRGDQRERLRCHWQCALLGTLLHWRWTRWAAWLYAGPLP